MNVSQILASSYTKLPGELVKRNASKQQRNASFQINYSEMSVGCIPSHAVHEGHRYGLYYVAVTRCESPLESLCNPTLLEWNTTDSSQCEQQECGPSSSAADYLRWPWSKKAVMLLEWKCSSFGSVRSFHFRSDRYTLTSRDVAGGSWWTEVHKFSHLIVRTRRIQLCAYRLFISHSFLKCNQFCFL